ncbi:hypothetical protein RJK19_00305 [Buchnera aphidicola (Ceratovacuna keduensis)]|uniref:hypothetical protein n=1 Tax=Buchnera aphidicola TaxID=9 RepID=UPI0031B8A0F7
MNNRVKLIKLLISLEKIKMKKVYKNFLNLLNYKKNNELNLKLLKRYKKIYLKKNNEKIFIGINSVEIKNFNNFLNILSNQIFQKEKNIFEINIKKKMFLKNILKNKRKINILKFFKLYLINKEYNKDICIIDFNNEELMQTFFLINKNLIFYY